MSSLRVLLVCCAVGVWLNACGAPADPEVAVAQLVFATYGAGDGVTVAYLAPVLAEQPAFATKRIWRGAGGRLAELPLASKSGPGPASARYTFRIVTQTAQRMTVEVSDNYEGGGGVTEQWELEQGGGGWTIRERIPLLLWEPMEP